MAFFHRRFVTALPLIAATLLPVVAGAAADKTLQHQRGAVSYEEGGISHAVAASVVLPDNAFAVTGARALARLSLPDSSVVDIGENTRVQVGAFNQAVASPGSTITVNHGALKFAIHHAAGGKSNYTFSTPTSQIAVRGTEGYLVVGDRGIQVVCTQCEPDDVRITTRGVVTVLLTGQVYTAVGNSPDSSQSNVTTTAGLNNPAINQFTDDVNPFANSSSLFDPTDYVSNSTATAAAAPATGVASLGTIAGIAAVAAGLNAISSTGNTALQLQTPIAVSPASLNFTALNQTLTFTVTGGSGAAGTGVTAVSNNPAVVRVGGTAPAFSATSVGVGTTTITVSNGASTATINVTVTGTVVIPQRTIHR